MSDAIEVKIGVSEVKAGWIAAAYRKWLLANLSKKAGPVFLLVKLMLRSFLAWG